MSEQTAGAWPPFLAPLREVLEPLVRPAGPFDPQGAWEHHYTALVLGPARLAAGDHPHPQGSLRLRRTPAGEGRFTLEVEQRIGSRAGSCLVTQAKIDCTADQLATPRAWELHTRIEAAGTPVAETAVDETGVARDGAIVRKGKVERTLSVTGPFTCNWALMEAVQRLPFEGGSPLAFELIEDLDLRKPEQRLMPVGPVTLALAAGSVRLHGFRQIGRGIHPTHFWLDDAHRLIAVSGSLRGFLWNTGAAPAPGKGR